MSKKALKSMSDAELREVCAANNHDDEEYCGACWALGAMGAGIPRSVAFGETKLKDHFSEEHIEKECAPKGRAG